MSKWHFHHSCKPVGVPAVAQTPFDIDSTDSSYVFEQLQYAEVAAAVHGLENLHSTSVTESASSATYHFQACGGTQVPTSIVTVLQKLSRSW